MVKASNPFPVDLSGRVALVTGASSGLGAHFVKTLSSAGAHVAAAARRLDLLKKLTTPLSNTLPLSLDVADPEAIPPAFDKIEASLGPVDILINNAGIGMKKPPLEATAADYDSLMGVNLRGAFFTAQECARRLIARETGGSIINIVSVGGQVPLKGSTLYCMSKAGLAMMTRSLALEWARAGIDVNGICPGYIETDLNRDFLNSGKGRAMTSGFPRAEICEAADLDAVLLMLAGRVSRMTGSLITVDNGQSLSL